MVQDAQYSIHDFVLEDRARRDVDTVTVISDDDDRALQVGERQ